MPPPVTDVARYAPLVPLGQPIGAARPCPTPQAPPQGRATPPDLQTGSGLFLMGYFPRAVSTVCPPIAAEVLKLSAKRSPF
jgi:hypothetical protein